MRISASVVTCGFVLLLPFALTGACSGEAFDGASTSSGSASLGGGSGLGGQGQLGGSRAMGGRSSGGAAAKLGGQGSILGGAMGIGGAAATGGVTGMGGSTGGAPPADKCDAPSECSACLYPKAPKVKADCYCPTCPTAAIAAELCTYNENAFLAEGCDTSQCPRAACAPPPPLTCQNGQCEFSTPGGVECQNNSDCTNCAYPSAPQSQQECYCTSCGEPRSVAACAANREAWTAQNCGSAATVCTAIACIEPAPVVCSAEGKCVAALAGPF